MHFYHKEFKRPYFKLIPIGDLHYGSRQCEIGFVKQVVEEIKQDKDAYWVGMGDLMENAIMGSKSDMYLQTIPPKEQMEFLVELLTPIKDKGLFLIAGNHEQRTMRQVGILPEQFISVQLGMPFMGFSCLANFQTKSSHGPRGFSCYFHHNYGGGYTNGAKVNRADQLRRIVPTADACFSAHFHTTSRIPVTWFEAGTRHAIKRVGYDYITGSALSWNESYAEEKGKPASTVEFIKVTFCGATRGDKDDRRQVYEVITPR